MAGPRRRALKVGLFAVAMILLLGAFFAPIVGNWGLLSRVPGGRDARIIGTWESGEVRVEFRPDGTGIWSYRRRTSFQWGTRAEDAAGGTMVTKFTDVDVTRVSTGKYALRSGVLTFIPNVGVRSLGPHLRRTR